MDLPPLFSTTMSTTTLTTSRTASSFTMLAMAADDRPQVIQLNPTDSTRFVRFDSECVLIPDSSKRPKIATRSYSLPLWKRRLPHPSSPAVPDAPEGEGAHIVLRVPIPTFIKKASRGRSPPNSPSAPLSPCLVSRSPPSSLADRKQVPSQWPPLPVDTTSGRKESALTVPLRACCTDCHVVAEECFKEGEEWKEKFTRGARRRRSASLDNSTLNTAITPSITDESQFSSSFALTVDEVDRRRKSLDYGDKDAAWIRQHLASTFSPTSRSQSSDTDSTSQQGRPKGSPIYEEEDEDQLFPLPSPRRTPNASPTPSRNASPSASLSASPAPSPNTSTSCLTPSVLHEEPEDGVLGRSFTRKDGSRDRLLPPDASNSLVSPRAPSPLSFSGIGKSKPSTDVPTPIPPIETSLAPPPSTGQSKPKLLPLTISVPSEQPESSFSPTLSPTSFTSSFSPLKSKPVPIPASTRSNSMTFPSSPKRASGSPSISPKRLRPSFTLPSPTSFLRAGADVLKGVSSMGASGMGL